MKTFGSTLRTIFAGLAIFALAVGCSEESNILNNSANSTAVTTQDGAGHLNKSGNLINNSDAYPQSNMIKLRYDRNWRQYLGGQMTLDGSVFRVDHGSFTPPDSLYGQHVGVTMSVDFDSLANELVFTFGPHGSQFSPAAEIWLKWSKLGSDVPNLYYIDDNGNYIPQQPDQVDLQNKWILIRVSHFSRYALAHG